MKQSFLYIANWKMNSSFEQSLNYATHNKSTLLKLAAQSDCTLVLCPSFLALHPMRQLLEDSQVYLGAQNCSAHEFGSYTGQIDATSLAQVGVNYCIIGHSESRIDCGETNELVGKKVTRLLEQKLIPIICIGETRAEHDQGQTIQVLEHQLVTISQALSGGKVDKYIIAYEPIWSIGTGIVPSVEHLTMVFDWLGTHLVKQVPHARAQLIYGGSVDEVNASSLKAVPGIGGFLIGSASLDFQKLQKIIVCTY